MVSYFSVYFDADFNIDCLELITLVAIVLYINTAASAFKLHISAIIVAVISPFPELDNLRCYLHSHTLI